MLKQYPPIHDGKPLKLTKDERRKIAQIIADAYIDAVLKFLKTDPGARPKLGERSRLLDFLGIQNERNAPWCSDWANFISDKLCDPVHTKVSIGGNEVSLDLLVRPQRVQTNWPDGYQHNYVVLRPFGRMIVLAKDVDRDAAITPYILYFDPWFRILPDVFMPGKPYDCIPGPHPPPTHLGVGVSE